ncbi:MAG: hypothetical protein SGI89_00960 [bacterium]|nr:hypothetical protein [bacterium]
MKLLYNRKHKLLQVLIGLILISITITGSNCEKILTGSGEIPTEMIGNWKLVEQTGALQDICENETVNFRSTGLADLTCPGSTTISRNFTIQNTELTYTESSISYDFEFGDSNNSLIFYGKNVSRNLKYQKIPVADNKASTGKMNGSQNSSEEVK